MLFVSFSFLLMTFYVLLPLECGVFLSVKLAKSARGITKNIVKNISHEHFSAIKHAIKHAST